MNTATINDIAAALDIQPDARMNMFDAVMARFVALRSDRDRLKQQIAGNAGSVHYAHKVISASRQTRESDGEVIARMVGANSGAVNL